MFNEIKYYVVIVISCRHSLYFQMLKEAANLFTDDDFAGRKIINCRQGL
jgi:hypothetical protein